HAGHAEINEHRINRRDSLGRKNGRQPRKIAVLEPKGQADSFQSLTGTREIVRIEINADQASLGTDLAKHFDGVPRPADRAIDDDLQGLQSKHVKHFLQKDRSVLAGRRAPSVARYFFPLEFSPHGALKLAVSPWAQPRFSSPICSRPNCTLWFCCYL